jgi:hypothetical protein
VWGRDTSRVVRIRIPATDAEPGPDEGWIGIALKAGETLKDEGRDRLHRALAEDRFDARAAGDVIKALWIRAFFSRRDMRGLPDWKTYGRMLLADPELGAFALGGRPLKDMFLARKGIETLCGGGALPGIEPGYTQVFEGDLKAMLQG